jgi:hypothetical protein
VTLENWEREMGSWKKKMRQAASNREKAADDAVAASEPPSSSSSSSSKAAAMKNNKKKAERDKVPWFASVLRVCSSDNPDQRLATVKQWGRRGGVCVIGYEALVSLVKPPTPPTAAAAAKNKKSKMASQRSREVQAEKEKRYKLAVKLLQDPGT